MVLDNSHYNHFTINYIEAVKFHLKIEIVEGGPIFIPAYIVDQDIINLKNDLEIIFESSQSAVSILKNKEDSKIQCGLFGLINNFDLALRTGFLLGDRIVAIDYIFTRLLCKKLPQNIDITILGTLCINLVSALELAKIGRFVIIPSPFYWHPQSKMIMEEVSKKSTLSPALMSLLNILSITKICQIHPFTIAESEEEYQSIINNQIDFVEEIGKDGGNYAYEGILGALVSEKLLNEVEFKTAQNIPIEEFYSITNSNLGFYKKYTSYITSGGSLSAELNIDGLKNDLTESIDSNNKAVINTFAKKILNGGGIGSAIISLLGSISIISPTLATIGAIAGLSSSLSGVIKDESKNNDLIIGVFKILGSK